MALIAYGKTAGKCIISQYQLHHILRGRNHVLLPFHRSSLMKLSHVTKNITMPASVYCGQKLLRTEAGHVCSLVNTCKTSHILRSCYVFNFISRQIGYYQRKKYPSIESQMISLINNYKTDEAVELLQTSVSKGQTINGQAVVELLEHLGEMADVDNLLKLNQLIVDHKICRIQTFYSALKDAFYNCGDVEGAVKFLENLYSNSNSYNDIDNYFTLITVMLLENFSQDTKLLLDFVSTCKANGDLLPTAGYWKCLCLVGNFDEADELLSREDIKRLLPRMANDIIHSTNEIETDRIKVLSVLKDHPQLKVKMRNTIYEGYVYELCANGMNAEALDVLWHIKESRMTLRVDRLPMYLSVINDWLEKVSDEISVDVLSEYSLKADELMMWIEEMEP